MENKFYVLYVPDEGHWDIGYYANIEEATAEALETYGGKLPEGSQVQEK